jgi:hypothetical protein
MAVPRPTVSMLRRPKIEMDYDASVDTAIRAGTVVPGSQTLPQSGHGEDADWRRRIQPPMTAFHQLFPAKSSSANSL